MDEHLQTTMFPQKDTPLEKQIGGYHYKKYLIQPVEYSQRNGLGYCEANVVKYITRWKDKGGLSDLEKARHYIDLLIQLEFSPEGRGTIEDPRPGVAYSRETGEPMC